MNAGLLMYREEIPDQVIKETCLDLESVGLKCEVHKQELQGPWSSLEWFVPTAIVLFIAKPYLESFLGEMGKDHYVTLKKTLGKLWERFFGKSSSVPEFTIMRGGREIQKPEYTHTFSIVAPTNDDRSIKLMLPEGISEVDFILHVEAFWDFLCGHHAGDDNAVIPSNFSIKCIDDQVFVSLSTDKQGVQFLDPLPKHIREKHTTNPVNR